MRSERDGAIINGKEVQDGGESGHDEWVGHRGTEEKTGAGPGRRVDGIRKENIRIREVSLRWCHGEIFWVNYPFNY